MTTAATPLSIYQLRIVLRGMSPLLWRRVLVRSDMTLAYLHTLLQIVFAWSNEPLHRFHIHGREYGSRGALTCPVQLRDFCLHRGERFRDVYDYGAHGECHICLEALRPLAPRRVYPVGIGGKGAGPPEDCRGAWADMERLEPHRLSPPLEAMAVVAKAISTLFAADPQTPVRAALGDLDDLREAVNCLETSQAFQPDHVARGDLNRPLLAWGQAAGAVRCRGTCQW